MKLAWIVLAATCGYVLVPDDDVLTRNTKRRRNAVVESTTRWLDQLEPAQRATASFGFEDLERRNWGFVPRERKGLALGAMSEGQRGATDDLLRTLLPPILFQTVKRVIDLEDVLREIEHSDHRDRLRYHVSVFGTPDLSEPFGVRFEGHHVSLNLTQVGPRAAWTPLFLGANPAVVKDSRHVARGETVLGPAMDAATWLVDWLTPEQRIQACLGDAVPGDVAFAPGTSIPEDLSGGLLLDPESPLDITTMFAPLVAWIDPCRDDSRFSRLSGEKRIAYAGSTEPGQPLYVRFVCGNLVFEYANVQNGANHVHVLVRDRHDDFGARLLADHLKSER